MPPGTWKSTRPIVNKKMEIASIFISDTGTTGRAGPSTPKKEEMHLKSVILLAAIGSALSENVQGRFYHYPNKKDFGLSEKMEIRDLAEAKKSEEFAGQALDGMYADCLARVSFSCVQKKVLNFINRMNRMEKFSILGSYVSIVRTKNEYEKEKEFQGRLDSAEEESRLDEVMESAVDRFLNSHIVRVKVPNIFTVVRPSESRSFGENTYLEFQFPRSDGIEARKKSGGGKMGKKMMMMMMMGLKAKLMMLGPLILGLAGILAIKALIASVISLTISKIMIIKKLMKSKGAGGHGGGGWDSSSSGGGGGSWSSGGGISGGGWDRRSFSEGNEDDGSWDGLDLAYRAYSTVENLF